MTHQDNQNQSNWGSFILGCLVGAGVGAAVGFLRAPQSGEKTRQQLQHAMGEVRKGADSVVSTTKDHIQEAREELSNHAADIKAEGEAAFKKTKQVLVEGVEDVKQEAKESAANVRQAASTT